LHKDSMDQGFELYEFTGLTHISQSNEGRTYDGSLDRDRLERGLEESDAKE
jgi:hypothetical protein